MKINQERQKTDFRRGQKNCISSIPSSWKGLWDPLPWTGVGEEGELVLRATSLVQINLTIEGRSTKTDGITKHTNATDQQCD